MTTRAPAEPVAGAPGAPVSALRVTPPRAGPGVVVRTPVAADAAETDWSSWILPSRGDTFAANLSPAELPAAGLLYYFEAIDLAQNVVTAPGRGPDAPFRVDFE